MDLEKLRLNVGQIRGDDFCHNAGWYDSESNKLGWGDLSCADLDYIAQSIGPESKDMFVAMPETASFWDFVGKVGIAAALCDVSDDINRPGLEYLSQHANLAITKELIHFLLSDERFKDEEGTKQFQEFFASRLNTPICLISRTDFHQSLELLNAKTPDNK